MIPYVIVDLGQHQFCSVKSILRVKALCSVARGRYKTRSRYESRRQIKCVNVKMATNADKMTKLDMKKDFDKLSEADKHYMKRLEALNMERVTKLKNLRYRNKITGLSIGGAVIGVCILAALLLLIFIPPPLQRKTTTNKQQHSTRA